MKKLKILLAVFVLTLCLPAFGLNNALAWGPPPPPPPPPEPLQFLDTPDDTILGNYGETINLDWSATSSQNQIGRSSKLWKCIDMEDFGIQVDSLGEWNNGQEYFYEITVSNPDIYYRIDVIDSSGLISDWVRIKINDTDGDNVPDALEINVYGTDPNDPYDNPKYALIVGISDYKMGLPYTTPPEDVIYPQWKDLGSPDNTADNWYEYLTDVCFYNPEHIVVLGDNHPDHYIQHDGKARESTIKSGLIWLASQNAYKIAFITSGHGETHDDGGGSSSICAWDSGDPDPNTGEDGELFDTEVAEILETSNADSIFIFLENCYSGGFGPELMAMPNSVHVYCTTTCTEKGQGHEASGEWGIWSRYFVYNSLIVHFQNNILTTMEENFYYARYLTEGCFPTYVEYLESYYTLPSNPPEYAWDWDYPQVFDGHTEKDTTL